MAPKLGSEGYPGTTLCLSGGAVARRRPACCPGGARCEGGASSLQALVWNRRTCRLDTVGQGWVFWLREGELRSAETGWGRVPRGTGADRPVVVMTVL